MDHGPIMPKSCASVAGIIADLGAELGRAREGMPRRRLLRSKPEAPFHIGPLEADRRDMRSVAVMNLPLRGIEANFGSEQGDNVLANGSMFSNHSVEGEIRGAAETL